MCGLTTSYKLQSFMDFYREFNLHRCSTRLCILLTVCFLFRAQSLDIDSAVCRCTTNSKFGKPFVVLWNSPTEGCHVNFSVNIELEKYGILTNSNQTWDGEVVTVFYNAQLGLYPYYRNDDKKMKFNGGLPQLVNLTEHLAKASEHIAEKIPEPNYSGLAVIDWEGWRPLWDTNFGKKYLYRTQSIALVKKEGKLKKKSQIEAEAKKRFSKAGKRLMVETIELGKKLRPRALWGFYGFPDCHGSVKRGYHCTKMDKKWNKRLRWLYKSSTALFPSIYLMNEHVDNDKFVAGKLTEAFRVSRMVADHARHGHDLPVFPYLRPLYHFGAREFKMLSEDDLENAIGQAVDYGSAGLILWGNHYDERTSQEICLKYNSYVNNKLGPYITLLREEIETCSRHKCSSNGRCVEKSVAVKNLKYDEETCRSVVKYGTVFKIRNHTTTEIQAPKQKITTLNTTARDSNAMPHKPENTKIKKHRLQDRNKHPTSKENKASPNEKASRGHETLTSAHNSTRIKSPKKSPAKLKSSGKRIEKSDSTRNKTNTKETSELPVWNKNGILGLKKKHNVDYISIKKMTGLEMLNGGKGINSSQDIKTAKKSNLNSTRSHKLNELLSKRKRNQKRGYSATASEETAVKVPGVYIILITVTLGGALLMTIIYVAIYYTVNVRGRSHDHSYEYESGDENPFSVDPHSPWWNDDVDPTEKLLKSKKEKK